MNTKPKFWRGWTDNKVVEFFLKTLKQIHFIIHLTWPAAGWCWSDDEIILFNPGVSVSPSDGWVGTGPDSEWVLIASRLHDFEDIIIFMDA